MRQRILAVAVFGAFGLALLGSPAALGHGGEELANQPARILAEQALAELEIRDGVGEAAERLDAALESEDQSDVRVGKLRQASETLDGDDSQAAILLLEQALSRPEGADTGEAPKADTGEAPNEVVREFQPGTGAQEIVGISVGAALLLLGGLLLLRGGRSTGPERT